jgi:transposase
MSATRKQYTAAASQPVLFVSFELGWSDWTLAFATGPAGPARLKKIKARDREEVLSEIGKAKVRFGLPKTTPVRTCYEAGRDGFWLDRWLTQQGMSNVIVDSSSIEVNRRARRAKSDRLDAAKLVQMLARYHDGEKHLWSLVRVPSVADEDQRQLHRDEQQLKAEQTEHSNRIKGLLALHGIAEQVNAKLAEKLGQLRTGDDQALPEQLRQRLLRELTRWQLVHEQILELEKERLETVRRSEQPAVVQVRRLLRLRAIGLTSSWLFVREFFGWRQIRNRRELASLAGLTPTPFNSGDSERDQGISKAGNRRVRGMVVEIAWSWLRYQQNSALCRWYWARFGKGSKRQRRIGIVALARKLLVALWRYLEKGVLPEGAIEVDISTKLGGKRVLVSS